MQKDRKYLLSLAAAASVFTTGHASANIEGQATPLSPVVGEPTDAKADNSVIVGNRDLFKFVLKRNGQGVMVADHESHYSHGSHASHSSHYSGY